jgi:RNA polymerase sigma-70 factor (ECF subfamily)
MTVSLETIELLIERTDWIRALARRLVGDAHLADDVAQEAALEALRAAPGARRIGPAWLAGIVRNVAANVRRRGARRAHHEGRAPAGAAPSAAQAAAFVEQQRLLADAVLALDAPFRDVVLLRFFEALPPRAIARRLGVPVATVNSRLQRALAKLRARLDARHGGERSAWVAALAPIAWRAPLEGTLTILGALAMQKKLLAAALVVAMFGAGTWIAGGFAPAPAAPLVPPELAQAGAAIAQEPAAAPLSPPVRDALPATAAPASAIGPRVRVVDALTDAPEPAAEVRLFPPEREADADVQVARMLQRGAVDDLEMPFLAGRPLPLAGDASLARPERPQAVLFARHGERMGVLELRKATADDERLRLWPLRSVRVRVVDASGRAAAGVPVVLRVATPGQTIACNLQDTGDDGLAVLRWFEPMRDLGGMRGRLEAALGFPGGEGVAAAVDAQAENVELLLECPPVGRVVVAVAGGAAQGPIALRSADDSSPPWTRPLADGRAEFWPVSVGGRLVAWVGAGNRSFTAQGDGPTFVGETVTLSVEVAASFVVTGRVLRDGAPLANAKLNGRLLGETEPAWLSAIETNAEGRFRFELAAGADTHALELLDTGEVRVTAALPAQRGPQPIELGDLELIGRAPFAAGAVVEADGTPVANARVHVLARSEHSSSGWDIVRIVMCDAQGRFSIPADAGDDPWLQALRAGPWRHEPERCARGARDLRLVLQPAGTLAGQLRAGDGVPLEHLSANLWDERLGAAQPGDWRSWVFASIDADGRFRFDGLRPGTYTLALSLPGRAHDAPLLSITGIAVGAGDFTRDARLSPLDLAGTLRTLTLRVRDEDGRPLRAEAFAILGDGRDRRLEDLGQTDRPLLLLAREQPRALIVEADGCFSARADVAVAEQDIVLCRGTPVGVQLGGVPALQAPFALRVALDPVTENAATRQARGYRERLRPDNTLLGQDGRAKLRVPAPGDYRLRIVVQRDQGGYLDELDVTPSPAPVVRVGEAGAELAAAADAAAIQAAVAKIAQRKR